MTEESVKTMCSSAFNELLDWRLYASENLRNGEKGTRPYYAGQVSLVNNLQGILSEIFGDLWPVDRCNYCGETMDGDTCHNAKCSINEVAA